jgi:hypothetical protein
VTLGLRSKIAGDQPHEQAPGRWNEEHPRPEPVLERGEEVKRRPLEEEEAVDQSQEPTEEDRPAAPEPPDEDRQEVKTEALPEQLLELAPGFGDVHHLRGLF